MRIYLDNCAYNRPYDDLTQLSVNLEAQAKLQIQTWIREEKYDLVTSEMLMKEIEDCPFEIRQKGEEEHYKEGDWKCYHCKNINYSFRTICNRCKLPKMIPFINNYANQMANQINLPVFKVPPSLYLFNNGKVIGYNNY